MSHLSPGKLRLAVGASLVGNTLEWYEFSLYIQFAPLFSILFFNEKTRAVALINTLLVFAVGFLSRPIGALFFGHLGDRLGRKKALISSVLIMTAPTFLIGLLPTYAQIGLAAPIFLACVRLLQGFPTGGEFPGAMCYLVEIAPSNQRGMMGSWAFFGSQLGSILSIFEFLVLKNFMTQEQLVDWGWRVLFFLGGILGLGGFYLRQKLAESPLFQEIKDKKLIVRTPVLAAIKNYKLPLIKGFFLSVLPLSGWYLIFVFSPLYFSEILGMSFKQNLCINLGMLILSNIFLPIFGRFADRYNKRVLLIYSAIGTIVLSYPLYFIIGNSSLALFIFFETFAVLFLTIQFALLPQLLCELFPTPVRYTCVGISYSFCNILFGGAAPALALSITSQTNNPLAPAFLLMTCAIISLCALLSIKEKKVVL